MHEVRRVWWDELLSRARCWLVRFRMRLGGIAVWVCPSCRSLTYWPAFFRDVGCADCAEGEPPCFRLAPGDWAFPRGRRFEPPAGKA